MRRLLALTLAGCAGLGGLSGGGSETNEDAGDATVADAPANADAGPASDASDADAPIAADAACNPACASVFETCVNGACACISGMTRCNGACVDLKNDPTHCGACDAGCAVGGSCANGACQCPMGTRCCSGTAACAAGAPGGVCEPQGSPSNCEVLCHPCPLGSGQGCVEGACANVTCNQGESFCSNGSAIGCLDTSNKAAYCGAMCKRCAVGEVCIQGACQALRPATGCTACPCNKECVELEGTNNSCCSIGGALFCVHGTVCP
jgi:hypothetical protein